MPEEIVTAKDEAYFIEVDNNGCRHCGSERTWVVIGPNGDASSVSFDHEEDAAELADKCNEAYEWGRASVVRLELPQGLPRPASTDEDWRAWRCGHNFPPSECRYEVCGYRDALSVILRAESILRVGLTQAQPSDGTILPQYMRDALALLVAIRPEENH